MMCENKRLEVKLLLVHLRACTGDLAERTANDLRLPCNQREQMVESGEASAEVPETLFCPFRFGFI